MMMIIIKVLLASLVSLNITITAVVATTTTTTSSTYLNTYPVYDIINDYIVINNQQKNILQNRRKLLVIEKIHNRLPLPVTTTSTFIRSRYSNQQYQQPLYQRYQRHKPTNKSSPKRIFLFHHQSLPSITSFVTAFITTANTIRQQQQQIQLLVLVLQGQKQSHYLQHKQQKQIQQQQNNLPADNVVSSKTVPKIVNNNNGNKKGISISKSSTSSTGVRPRRKYESIYKDIDIDDNNYEKDDTCNSNKPTTTVKYDNFKSLDDITKQLLQNNTSKIGQWDSNTLILVEHVIESWTNLVKKRQFSTLSFVSSSLPSSLTSSSLPSSSSYVTSRYYIAAVSVEKLVQRIVLEQKYNNPYVDNCIDLTSLYTNLIICWANSGDSHTGSTINTDTGTSTTTTSRARTTTSSVNAPTAANNNNDIKKYSGIVSGPERAEEILDYMQYIYEQNDSVDPLFCGPTIDAFNAIIEGYARRRQRKEVIGTNNRKTNNLATTNNKNDKNNNQHHTIRSNTESSNGGGTATIQDATTTGTQQRSYTTATTTATTGTSSSSSSSSSNVNNAARVLHKLYQWNQQGRTIEIPGKETYAHILRAMATTTNSPTAPEQVLQILQQMEHLSALYPNVKPDTACHNMYILAVMEAPISNSNNNNDNIKIKSKLDAARICQSYLEYMLEHLDETIQPDTWTFNMVLNAWSKTNSNVMIQQAEQLVNVLEQYHSTSNYIERTQPNTNTYNTLLSCYSHSPQSLSNPNLFLCPKTGEHKAYTILQKMKQLYNSGINVNAQPDAITYNIVMNMVAKVRRRNSPVLVEELLQEIIESYRITGNRKMRPSTRTINSCLDAWVRSGSIDADDRVWEWITRMKAGTYYNNNSSVLAKSNKATVSSYTDSDSVEAIVLQPLRPDKWTYNSYLQALSKSNKTNIGTLAENVLYEMEQMYNYSTAYSNNNNNIDNYNINDIKPDVITFTNVIHCVALSGQDDAIERALSIVDRMEDLHEQGYGDLRPNLFTYNCVINTIAKSKRIGKAKLALDVLRRAEDAAIRPVIVSYNNVLNACAFSCVYNDNKDEVLHVAYTVLNETKSNIVGVHGGRGIANWITYQTVIRTVCVFENNSTKRYEQIINLLHQCCIDKQLTHTVLGQIRYGVTTEQYDTICKNVTDPITHRLYDMYAENAKLTMNTHQTRLVST